MINQVGSRDKILSLHAPYIKKCTLTLCELYLTAFDQVDDLKENCYGFKRHRSQLFGAKTMVLGCVNSPPPFSLCPFEKIVPFFKQLAFIFSCSVLYHVVHFNRKLSLYKLNTFALTGLKSTHFCTLPALVDKGNFGFFW
jgi:hypothetical protein